MNTAEHCYCSAQLSEPPLFWNLWQLWPLFRHCWEGISLVTMNYLYEDSVMLTAGEIINLVIFLQLSLTNVIQCDITYLSHTWSTCWSNINLPGLLGLLDYWQSCTERWYILQYSLTQWQTWETGFSSVS